jgi:hypothetical protein
MESSQPYTNQANILISSLNSLTSQKFAIVAKPHAKDTPSHISTFADRLETPIECTLNAFSLFQKPIQLFSSPSSSLTNQTNPLTPNQVDPS